METIFDKNRTAELIRLYSGPRTYGSFEDLAEKLKTLADERGKEVFMQDDLLEILKEADIAEIDALRITALTKVNGFKELLDEGRIVPQADLNRFVTNVEEQCGFDRQTSLSLISSLALALGIAWTDREYYIGAGRTEPEQAFVLPPNYYSEQLKAYELSYRNGDDLEGLDMQVLQEMSAMGIPRAKALFGHKLLMRDYVPENGEKGLELLREATVAGDSIAAAELADYYYDQGQEYWETAYDLYTEYGAFELNENRKDALVSILNLEKRNKAVIVGSLIMGILMLVLTIVIAGFDVFGGKTVIGILLSVIAMGIPGLALWAYNRKPHKPYIFTALAVFIVWVIYILIRVLF